jgi:hypothetical protein
MKPARVKNVRPAVGLAAAIAAVAVVAAGGAAIAAARNSRTVFSQQLGCPFDRVQRSEVNGVKAPAPPGTFTPSVSRLRSAGTHPPRE